MLWMTPKIKRMILEKAKIYQCFVGQGKVLLTIKFFKTLPQGAKLPLKRPNLITFPVYLINFPIFHTFHNNTFLIDTLVKVNTFNSFLQSNVFYLS